MASRQVDFVVKIINFEFMMMLGFLKNYKKCEHPNISPAHDEAYCPDCGEYVKNTWYLTRCSCCRIKRKSVLKNGEITPVAKFCSNCGNSGFQIEKIERINFIDIPYAVLVKETIKRVGINTNQVWVDEFDKEEIRLLGLRKN